MTANTNPVAVDTAVLDPAHVGDIQGALGTIRLGDTGPRRKMSAKFRTLIAIVGPGLIVMVGDNDAGAFGTYTQAGQNYGTHLLWTLLLLVPVLYINQEMALRLGAVSGVGHAKLILERFGKFWGAFSVIDLFVLNGLTIITEFIGVSLGLSYLGIPKIPGVIVALVFVVVAASTGSFRRFERLCLLLVVASLTLIPIVFIVHPPISQVATNFVVPGFPPGAQVSSVILLIIGIVGTTVAPWQLFFQQSYVVDKRITPRFMKYERVDLGIGIAIVIVGAAAMMAFTAATFVGTNGFGNFTDAGGVAAGLGHYVSKLAGVLFAIALIDASTIGAAAVGLSTSYALSDVLGLKHSLHRKVRDAKGFYAIFAGILAVAATIVLIPGSPLGILTSGVQVLAGVLLPSASVFLLLLCNDKAVLGPWTNKRGLNIFTGAIVAILVMLSVILTSSVLFPDISSGAIIGILVGGSALGLIAGTILLIVQRRTRTGAVEQMTPEQKMAWRMPPIASLEKPRLSLGRRMGLGVLRGYLLIAAVLVVIRVIQLAIGQ